MFYISAGVFASATLLFWLFGSAEIQPWNDLGANKEPINLVEEEKPIAVPAVVPTTEEEEENEKL